MIKSSNSTRSAGKFGEDYACKVLEKDGFRILCRNYTCKGGEIDIIAEKGKYLCFVEVKTRSLASGVSARESVNETKTERIKTAAIRFLEEYRDNEYVSSLLPRFDLIEIYTACHSAVKYIHTSGII